MEKDYFINKIQKDFKEKGNSYYSDNQEYIANEINKNSLNVQQYKFNDIRKGDFCFMFYDLNGKSSALEKFNPLLIIDWFDIENTRMVYAVSINFIPVNIRVMFFNKLLNYNLDVIEYNNDKDINKQKPLDGINFVNVYKLLSFIGFEWAIRKFDIKYINKTYKISTKILPEFITMSTYKFTKVGDDKLVEIWQKKIKEQEQRHKKIIKEILNDVDNMSKEFDKTYKTLDEKQNSLEESLKIINNMK